MKIEVLDQSTIDKIAAGEVIERPASIVKELVENAIDAGASSVTVEIKDGGISFIRITDNGVGIPEKEVPSAFLRHATSKIRKVEDLLDIHSLGFRGEALSSIAAVCQVEMLTKTQESLVGIRYQIEGGEEKAMEEVGIPEGTTFLVRNLFYNTPARKKFLKSSVTETGYISDLIEKIALSHPEISFKFISNHQIKLHTSGNSDLKDIVYNVFGREIASQVMPVYRQQDGIVMEGLIGKPVICRGNRNYECCFINGRYIKSKILMKAIEDGYKAFLMQHKYPFAVLHLRMDGSLLDINVHPSKLEVHFWDNDKIYRLVESTIRGILEKKEFIPEISLSDGKEEKKTQDKKSFPEPFEKKRMMQLKEERKEYSWENKVPDRTDRDAFLRREPTYFKTGNSLKQGSAPEYAEKRFEDRREQNPVQITLFDKETAVKTDTAQYRIIGQAFDTYWLVQYQNKLYIIDQHAAHEKVLYERIMKSLKDHSFTSQMLSPPVVIPLSMQEEELFLRYHTYFEEIGFEIESFGGREYSIRAIPGNLFGIEKRELFQELLDSLSDLNCEEEPEILKEKIASMSCKAAVKGNHQMAIQEAENLISELLKLENPYHCPHGRPTIISMTKYEIEKKFKRIL